MVGDGKAPGQLLSVAFKEHFLYICIYIFFSFEPRDLFLVKSGSIKSTPVPAGGTRGARGSWWFSRRVLTRGCQRSRLCGERRPGPGAPLWPFFLKPQGRIAPWWKSRSKRLRQRVWTCGSLYKEGTTGRRTS